MNFSIGLIKTSNVVSARLKTTYLRKIVQNYISAIAIVAKCINFKLVFIHRIGEKATQINQSYTDDHAGCVRTFSASLCECESLLFRPI